MEAGEVLEDHRNAGAQLPGIDSIDVSTIPHDGARCRPIKPCQEFASVVFTVRRSHPYEC
jgi:hypothetical protein